MQHRQRVLSVSKRVGRHLRYRAEVISDLVTVFLHAGETTLCQRRPGAPAGGRFGAVAFDAALDLDAYDCGAVRAEMRKCGQRWLHRHSHLDDDALHAMDSREHLSG